MLKFQLIGHPRADLLDTFHARGWQLSDDSPDVILFDHYRSEEQHGTRIRREHPQALRVLAVDALHSLHDARQQLLRRRLAEGLDSNDFRALFATSGPDLYQQMATAALTQREIAALYRCDLSLISSDVEIDLLCNGFGLPQHLLHWCPGSRPAVTEALHPYAEREHFVMLGDYRSAANADALLWLKHSLWPMLRRRLPDAQVHVYGANLADNTVALHCPTEGFHLHGPAEDPTAVLSAARVCLAPLRFGAGIKPALLDALHCGTPSVTTPIGSEAMHGALPWPGAVVSLAEALADAAANLYRDEARWQQAQQQARQLLANRYAPRWHCEALAERIEQALLDLSQHRLFNFTGAMLCRLTDAAASTCP
ncbi:glycosyltransferase [Pseudomonas sp. SDI]|uniref:glycosyltransferase family 4 protein n=1 Tax=Pseudomonas sp. SDI TaxID=2170734 RepID=UPI000DE74D29|nr:glycosyltransferase family 4 protein [Pseudomonas sp. SDI]PWB31015.1 glycosyltransferase [Pseudomonas sp. SDI]